MKDLGDIMKQAAGLQSKMQEMQERLGDIEAEGAAGAGMVRVTLTGKGYAKNVSIDPSLMGEGDHEVVEDLIAAAINDAKAKLEERTQEEVKKLTEGLPLPPGMKLPF
ncbi:MAG: YbaB/EbfC family nucleoid-associated protein [Pseudomonadota bacterium]